MPFSYAQYAGNGSTTTFSVPFPYLLKAHVKLYTGYSILSGTYTTQLIEGTDYSWTSGTQIQTTTAPVNGVTLTVLRDTPDGSQLVPWQDGSNLTADDFNNADLQNLYVVQEQQDRNDAGAAAAIAAQSAANSATAAATAATTAANTANATAAAATTAANNATTAANTSTAASTAATATANQASTNAAAAVSTANTAASNASTALSTANAASANANNAVTTANTASSNASAAVSTANTAASNAQAAVSTANSATTTANSALTTAQQAVSTANTANTTAGNALSTANTANTAAANAVSTANTANTTANQAAAAVSQAVLFTLVANVAALPASPANNTYIEVGDSTGIQSFSPLTGLPVGFIGDAGLTVRLRYTTAGSTWNYLSYFANNPETRYIGPNGGTLNGQLRGDDSASASTPGFAFDGDPDTGLGRPGANELALITGGVARLTFDSSGAAAFTGSVTIPAGSTVTGYLTSATAASTYLTQANAASTYQAQSGMSSYLTTSAASSTYAPLASPTFTGTVTIPAGASISGYLTSATAASTYQPISGMSSYLTSATAASTYQTQAGMSSYLTTSAAGSTYAPLASPTFTGTVTIPAGASISGYAALGTAQSFTKAQRGTVSALTDGATITPDFAAANNFSVTLGGNRTLANPTNLTAGQSGAIVVTQDGTGSRTLAYGSNWKFPGGTAPTLTTTASAVDVIAYYVESATRITARLIADVK